MLGLNSQTLRRFYTKDQEGMKDLPRKWWSYEYFSPTEKLSHDKKRELEQTQEAMEIEYNGRINRWKRAQVD